MRGAQGAGVEEPGPFGPFPCECGRPYRCGTSAAAPGSGALQKRAVSKRLCTQCTTHYHSAMFVTVIRREPRKVLTSLSMILTSTAAFGAEPPDTWDRAQETTQAVGSESIEKLSTELKLPPIEDDMLSAPPQPPTVLMSWAQGLKQVKERSTALESAYAAERVAEGSVKRAWAGTLPQVSGTGNVGHHLLVGEADGFAPGTFTPVTVATPDPATTWQAVAAVSQQILALQVWNNIGVANSARTSAEASSRDAERQAIGALARAILSVITAERLSEIGRVSLHSTLVNLELTRSRHQLGDATALDVLRSEAEVDLTRANLITANEVVRKARETLGLVLGYPAAWGISPKISLDTLWDDARSTCRKLDRVTQRADLKAKAQDVHTADLKLDDFAYSFIPNISFLAELSYIEPSDKSINQQNVTWSLGGVLTWNIYDGGLRYGDHVTNQGNLALAQANFTKAKRDAIIEVERTRREVEVARSTLKVTRHAREVSSKSAELAQISFVHGTGTAFILVDATRRLREAELDEAVKQFRLVTAKIEATLAISNCEL